MNTNQPSALDISSTASKLEGMGMAVWQYNEGHSQVGWLAQRFELICHRVAALKSLPLIEAGLVQSNYAQPYLYFYGEAATAAHIQAICVQLHQDGYPWCLLGYFPTKHADRDSAPVFKTFTPGQMMYRLSLSKTLKTIDLLGKAQAIKCLNQALSSVNNEGKASGPLVGNREN